MEFGIVTKILSLISPLVLFLLGIMFKVLWDRVTTNSDDIKDLRDDNEELEKEIKRLNDKINEVEKSLSKEINDKAMVYMEILGKVNSTLSRIEETLRGINLFMNESKRVDLRQDEDIKKTQESLSTLREEVAKKQSYRSTK